MTAIPSPATEYRACVDPLHRNSWPVRVEGDEMVIGYLTEHITVALDGADPPHVRWSWKFSDAEADALRVDEGLRSSRGRYPTWRRALDQFAQLHQLAVGLREAEWNQSTERAGKG